MSYHSYTEGTGPWHIWGERASSGQSVGVHLYKRELRDLLPDRPERLFMPECDGEVYSDRLYQQNYEKTRLCAEQHLSNGFGSSAPEEVSAFLSAFLGRPVQVVTVWQWNHAMSGNPIWQLFFKEARA